MNLEVDEGKWLVKLANVLAAALDYDRDLLNQVTIAALNKPLNAIAPVAVTTDVAALRVVMRARVGSPKAVLRVVEEAREVNPDNPELSGLAEFIALKTRQCLAEGSTERPVVFSGDEGNPERILHRLAGFVDVLQFRQTMARCEAAVCRIEVPNGQAEGTGFLVGPDLVLTNYHVFEPVWDRVVDAMKVVTRFDYKTVPNSTRLPEGRPCGLASDWKVAWSVDGDGREELDFLLFRLADEPGRDSAPEFEDGVRGWLKPVTRDLEIREPLLIIQHPLARPLQLSFGGVMEVDAPNRRIVHDANTEPGSSGSPCFDGQWKPVALHYFGSKSGNRAVEFGPILERILPTLPENGRDSVEATAPP